MLNSKFIYFAGLDSGSEADIYVFVSMTPSIYINLEELHRIGLLYLNIASNDYLFLFFIRDNFDHLLNIV